MIYMSNHNFANQNRIFSFIYTKMFYYYMIILERFYYLFSKKMITAYKQTLDLVDNEDNYKIGG